MDIYDSRYYSVNKTLLASFGLWPYQNYKQKLFIRTLMTVVLCCISVPQLDFLYCNIAKNWEIVRDFDERKILINYSERGRILTIGYVAYLASTTAAFNIMPLTPVVLNILKPLNVSRPCIFILGGEFLIDRNKHYLEIYIFDFLSTTIAASLMSAFDSMYGASVEHCLALFAIINFTEILEETYSSTFLILVGLNMLIISLICVLILLKIDQLMDALRFIYVLLGTVVHLFIYSWPGQALNDYSISLSDDAYANEWYKASIASQRSLQLLTLRCSRPCQLTAGGIYFMNFSNFAKVIKTSLSYMTVVLSTVSLGTR